MSTLLPPEVISWRALSTQLPVRSEAARGVTASLAHGHTCDVTAPVVTAGCGQLPGDELPPSDLKTQHEVKAATGRGTAGAAAPQHTACLCPRGAGAPPSTRLPTAAVQGPRPASLCSAPTGLVPSMPQVAQDGRRSRRHRAPGAGGTPRGALDPRPASSACSGTPSAALPEVHELNSGGGNGRALSRPEDGKNPFILHENGRKEG